MKPCTHVWGRKILWLQIKNLLPWLIVFPFKGTPLGNALRDMSLSTWEINPGIMGRQSGWCNEPGNYKACPNEAVTSFLCLHKHSAWNVIRVGIHTFFVLPVWERKHAPVSAREHCDVLPLQTLLRSRLRSFTRRALRLAFPRALIPLLPRHKRRL